MDGGQPDPRGQQPYPPPCAYLQVTLRGGGGGGGDGGGQPNPPLGPPPSAALDVRFLEALPERRGRFTVENEYHGLLILPAGGAPPPLPPPPPGGHPQVMVPGNSYQCGNFNVRYLLPDQLAPPPAPHQPGPAGGPPPSSGSRRWRRDGSDDDSAPPPARRRTEQYQVPSSVPQHQMMPVHFGYQSLYSQNLPLQPDEQMLSGSSIHTSGFELDTRRIFQDLKAISINILKKARVDELISTVNNVMRNTYAAIRSVTSCSTSPINDFDRGLPNPPSSDIHNTSRGFEDYLVECCKWIEEVEQLVVDTDKAFSSARSWLEPPAKSFSSVLEIFLHLAVKVENIHQYIESKKKDLADGQHLGDAMDLGSSSAAPSASRPTSKSNRRRRTI